MPEVLVLQHHQVEPAALIGEHLRAAQHTVRTVRAGEGEAVPGGLDGAGALLVMGGPMGVGDERSYPFLKDERRLIEQALTAALPVLGVCLGSQLLASALGAAVTPGARKEIGWFPVALTPEGLADPVLSPGGAAFTPLHWHGDVFTLPRGAVPLARSAVTAHQAFRYGGSAYGLLFHLEVTAAQVEAMVDAFGDELRAAGVDGAVIRRDAIRRLEALRPVSHAVIASWVRLIAGGA